MYNRSRHQRANFDLDRLLHKSIEKGHMTDVIDLISSGASLNSYIDGITPTAKAILSGHQDVALYLLSKNASTFCGRLFFDHQLDNMVDGLLDYSTAPSVPTVSYHQPLLLLAAEHGFEHVVQDLIKRGCDTNISDDLKSQTALHAAVDRAHPRIVNLLIDDGANINKVDTLSRSPLHLAVMKNEISLVEKLICKGAAVNIPGRHDQLPLHTACQNGNLEMTKRLIQSGSMLNCPDAFGCLPLHYAAEKDNVDILELLLDNNASVGEADEMGDTVLNRIIVSGNLKALKLILAKGKVDLNQENGKGPFRKFPLQTAATKGNTNIVDCLIDCGADINMTDSLHGESALHWAVHAVDHCMVKHLILRGIDISIANYPDRQTCIHAACSADKDGNCIDILSTLIQNGASVNHARKSGGNEETPLHIAARRGCKKIMQLLLEQDGIDLESTNANGYSPLRMAILHNQQDICNLLISKSLGCLINSNKNNIHEVSFAIQCQSYEIAIDLLQHGAPVHSIHPLDSNPLLCAFKPFSRRQLRNVYNNNENFKHLVTVLVLAGVNVHGQPNSALRIASEAGATDLNCILNHNNPAQPYRLHRLCVWQLRDQALIASGGRSIQGIIKELPLPQCIKEQLFLLTG